MKSLERIDRLELLHTLIRIVEAGSLSGAARQLEVSQATVSRRLSTLEQLLGAKLLLRTTHATKLTDDGERCYQHAKNLIDDWLNLEDELKQVADEPVGLLRVRAPHAFGQQQLLLPVLDFLKRSPALNIEWRLSDAAPDFLADHIDCAIHVGFEPDPNTVAILLAEVPRIMVASPELLARFPEIENIEDLQSFPWLELSTYYRHEIQLNNQITQEMQRVPIQSRLSTDSLFVLKNAALQGLGIAVISSWLAVDALADGTLVNILPEWQAAPLPVYLVYPWARYYPARLRQFLSLMREVMPTISGIRQLK